MIKCSVFFNLLNNAGFLQKGKLVTYKYYLCRDTQRRKRRHSRGKQILGSDTVTSEPVFVNVYGAQESILKIDFASLCSLAGRYEARL
jgi:hypothetical protein